ncbi:MAG: hypothetical protein K0B37_08295 [Bacteroidales bacterium]|nr:hypothetical protein [Bacteroidales bacterium]
MHRLLQTLMLLFLWNAALKAESIEAVIYNGTGAPLEHRLASMTLAGIVNREEPRLYLLNVYETWSFNQTDESWRDIYQQDGNVVFTEISDFQQLIDHFENDINGAITYDPSLTYGNFTGQDFSRVPGTLRHGVKFLLAGGSTCTCLTSFHFWHNTTITRQQKMTGS